MKVFVIGGVAAGTKTAAKLKRENRDAEVTILNYRTKFGLFDICQDSESGNLLGIPLATDRHSWR